MVEKNQKRCLTERVKGGNIVKLSEITGGKALRIYQPSGTEKL